MSIAQAQQAQTQIDKIVQTDKDKEFIATDTHGDVTVIYIPNFQYTTLGKFIIYRLLEDRDVKILITGKGKTTGTGKTTVAIALARFVNWVRNELFDFDTEWSSKEYSFMNVWDYLEKYETAKSGDPLITDELEYMADRRKHQTHENIYFSQAWSVLRYKNVVTIGTAPGLMDLEKRIPEGADIWINVIHKGKGNVYYLTFEDFPPYRAIFKRLRNINGFKESILWNPINDNDYEYLKQQKTDIGVPGLEEKQNQITESDMNQLERNIRNDYVKKTLLFLDEKNILDRFTQTEIADMTNVSQPQVSKIKLQMEKEGELQ